MDTAKITLPSTSRQSQITLEQTRRLMVKRRQSGLQILADLRAWKAERTAVQGGPEYRTTV